MGPATRVAIVAVYPNGDRTILEVMDAQLTLEREDMGWYGERLQLPSSTMRVRLEGIAGSPRPYTGPMPDDPEPIERAPIALPSAPPRSIEGSA